MLVQQKLINWYNKNKRILPWRNTKNAYFIWLSEIILQQTRVEQGLPYYLKFVEKYPTVEKLANASPAQILKLWQGLGYYSRARNMHAAAIEVVNNYNGKFPLTVSKLMALKGIGAYTAAAIASFAANVPVAVLDGNVFRVLARFYGISNPINDSKSKKVFNTAAEAFLNKTNPAQHNQAIMELGALVCTPRNPDCPNCPLADNCFAFQNQTQQKFPVKTAKLKPRIRYFNYLILYNKGNVYLNKRNSKDIWQHLYEPILIETKTETDLTDFVKLAHQEKLIDTKAENILFLKSYKHLLTHQTLHARFYFASIKGRNNLLKKYNKVKINDVYKYPIHRLFEKFWVNFKLPL